MSGLMNSKLNRKDPVKSELIDKVEMLFDKLDLTFIFKKIELIS